MKAIQFVLCTVAIEFDDSKVFIYAKESLPLFHREQLIDPSKSQVPPIDLKHEKHFQEQKQLDPIVPEQANHPISVQCPTR